MAYTHFLDGKPDGTTTGAELPVEMQEQLNALRDALVAFSMFGWNYSLVVGTGTKWNPQYHYYKNGAEWIRKTLTWGTSGGANGNTTQAVFQYSSNSGVDWSLTLGTCSYTYDADGICTNSTWS